MTVFNIIALILREQDFFKHRVFLLTHPVQSIFLPMISRLGGLIEFSIA